MMANFKILYGQYYNWYKGLKSKGFWRKNNWIMKIAVPSAFSIESFYLKTILKAFGCKNLNSANYLKIWKEWGQKSHCVRSERCFRDCCPKFITGLKCFSRQRHRSKNIWVTRLFLCKNDSLIVESLWQKDSLVTLILFELCLFWYLAQSQILGNSLYLFSKLQFF